jgi:peptidoglycan/LPS O-acetylase OafA/YrhL
MSIYGYPVWIEHPLQFFGFSSQPPSVPIIVSLLSQSSSISSEKVVLFISIATCVIGIFSFYAFVSFITNDDFIRFYSTFVFSTSPEFLRMTMWTITTRALFIALLPLFLYLLFKLKQEQSKKNFILFLSLLLFLFSVHHLGFLQVDLVRLKIILVYG